jgi:hypothetical protein
VHVERNPALPPASSDAAFEQDALWRDRFEADWLYTGVNEDLVQILHVSGRALRTEVDGPVESAARGQRWAPLGILVQDPRHFVTITSIQRP